MRRRFELSNRILEILAGDLKLAGDPQGERLRREAIRGLRKALNHARAHAIQIDDGLESIESQAVQTVSELIGLALKTLDRVETFREPDPGDSR